MSYLIDDVKIRYGANNTLFFVYDTEYIDMDLVGDDHYFNEIGTHSEKRKLMDMIKLGVKLIQKYDKYLYVLEKEDIKYLLYDTKVIEFYFLRSGPHLIKINNTIVNAYSKLIKEYKYMNKLIY